MSGDDKENSSVARTQEAGGYLKNDGEVHHDEGGAQHQVLLLYLGLIQHGGQTIRNGPSQATVAHDDLLDELQRNQPELVVHPLEAEDTCEDHGHSRECLECSGGGGVLPQLQLTYESVDEDEEKREEDEARVPHPDGRVHGRDAQEDKDDGFRSVGQNLHDVFDRDDGLLVHVGVDVLLAARPTEGYSGKRSAEPGQRLEVKGRRRSLSGCTDERMADSDSISAVR